MTPEPLRSPLLPLAHGFFTRQGGVSTGPYAASIAASRAPTTRRRCWRTAPAPPARSALAPAALVGLTQVHGVAVVRVDTPWAPGAGPRADAMVTNRPGVALGIVTADCAPVLFADSQAGVVGAAHAGWRGAAAGVIEATLAAMVALGADPARIAAAIGPCIGQDSYEVGADLRAALQSAGPDGPRFLAPGRREDRWQFDLPGYCAARLRTAGVATAAALAADTAADPDRFFSHRRRTLSGGGPIGHQISVIALAG